MEKVIIQIIICIMGGMLCLCSRSNNKALFYLLGFCVGISVGIIGCIYG